MPWLLQEAEKVLDEKILARMLLDSKLLQSDKIVADCFSPLFFALLGIIRDTVAKILSPPQQPTISEPTEDATDAQPTSSEPPSGINTKLNTKFQLSWWFIGRYWLETIWTPSYSS